MTPFGRARYLLLPAMPRHEHEVVAVRSSCSACTVHAFNSSIRRCDVPDFGTVGSPKTCAQLLCGMHVMMDCKTARAFE